MRERERGGAHALCEAGCVAIVIAACLTVALLCLSLTFDHGHLTFDI